MILAIFYLIVIILLLVLVHEFGHFWAARKTGVTVEEFGFGLPPRACSITSKKSKTIYSLNWLPIGGFVRLKGELGGEVQNAPINNANDPDSFSSKKLWQRIVIVSGGVVMNLVLAIILLAIGYIIGLPQEINKIDAHNYLSSGLEKKFATITDAQIHITYILPKTPAEKAGLQVKDIIIDIDGEKFNTISDVRTYLSTKRNKEVLITLKRDNNKIFKEITPQFILDSSTVGLGVSLYQTGTVSYPLYITPIAGLLKTYDISKEMFMGIGELIKNIFSKKDKASLDIAGPVGIVSIIAKVSKLGFAYMLQFAALLSINLAIINFIPFPALDGGRFIFLAIEGIRRKKINPQTETIINNIGFALLLTLIVFVTYKDIVRLITE